MVLESLIPALEASIAGHALPAHIREIRAEGIAHVKLIDATPIGINVRSTVATYAGVHDELRKLYAKSPDAKAQGYKASDFSYNTGSLCAAPAATARAWSAWTCSSCRMWTFPAPTAAARAMHSAAYDVKLHKQGRGRAFRCPS